MTEPLQKYREIRQELMRQIAVTKRNKDLLQSTLRQWQQQLKAGIIDFNTYANSVQTFLQGKAAKEWRGMYDVHLKKCNDLLIQYANKQYEDSQAEEPKGTVWSKLGIVAIVLVLFFTFLLVSNTNITGLFIFNQDSGEIVFEDGYGTEGSKWADIKGSRIYERCLKIESGADFDSVKLIGKITSARESNDLTLSIFTNNQEQPGEKIGACTVKDYENVWKSCTIKEARQQKGSYWICAGTPSGEREQTYYTIAYSIGDPRKTALWTGQNWQKLDRTSYTLKAQFLNHD